ncbi:Paraflagellar rod protein Variant SH3 domain [Trypanosoma vivax]|uniref:Putative paraflagellar rod protein n=1 Tax=Trypanosoma vivax (strain Y486) TaxID=1055687 RepID=G0TRY0_TRYVY|nr:putative paraflagellar rod protein [Trypanosoma vivax]KAH8617418.1 Paraflagellar rod protein Variant SH3 domain [Trypanosoma vivax]CCC46703.1 putative paraflagellar rod protein [Trypanosoma vivax Y486]
MASAATLFQRNKRIYIQEEEKLKNLISDEAFQEKFGQWLESTITQLDVQYELCEQQLAELQQSVAVEAGSYWCSKTIIKHCNLHMNESRLVAVGVDMEEHASLPDVVNLVSCLQQLKTQSFITRKQEHFIEQCESQFKNVVFEPRELVCITNALQIKLRDVCNAWGVFNKLSDFQNSIETLSPDVNRCEQLLEASIVNGEMALAEEISGRQLEIFERILRLINDQYPVIRNYYTESCDSDKRRRWEIFRMADKDISTVIEGKYRQIEACEEDLIKIKEQIENYNNDDSHQRKRYETDRNISDEFLQNNKEKQQSVWNRMFELFKEVQRCQEELSKLATKRRREIDRRLEMEEQEARRRSGHEAFIKAAAEHAQKLQHMINNALEAKDIAISLNNFVLDGCDTIAAKFDKQQDAFGEVLRVVQNHHFKRFSDYYLAASRFIYRKERRLQQIEEDIKSNEMRQSLCQESFDVNAKTYAELNKGLLLKRRELAQEVLNIRHRLERAEKDIEHTLRSLRFSGVEYIHPRDIVEKVNLNRCSTILDYREFMLPSVPYDEKVAAEEAETLSRIREIFKLESEQRAKNRRVLLPQLITKHPTPLQRNVDMMLSKRTEEAQVNTYPPPQLHSKFVPQTATLHEKGTENITASLTQRIETKPSAQVTHPSTAHLVSSHEVSTEAVPGRTVAPQSPINAHRMSTSSVSYTMEDTHGGQGIARMEGTTVRALYAYKARAPDELSFEKNDLIVCVSRAEEGWFKGVCNQRTGLFPINYVVPIDERTL